MCRRTGRLLWLSLSLALVACTGVNPEFRAARAVEGGPVDAPSDAAADAAGDAGTIAPQDASTGEPAPSDDGPPADAPMGSDMAAGQVSGLRGDYFIGRTFDTLAFSRVDGTIDFGWVHAPPDPRLPEDDFSIRWTGEIAPRYSELYTFHADHDDGVRVWVGGTAVLDRWTQTGQDTRGQISLQAGQRYSLRVEHFDMALTATMRLSWSSASQSKEIVPATRLFTPPLP
jgi:hypothetical protein